MRVCVAASAAGPSWFGVDVHKEDVSDNYEAAVWEPAIVRVSCDAWTQMVHDFFFFFFFFLGCFLLFVCFMPLHPVNPTHLLHVCVQVNALTAASEAACMILSVDETVKAPTSDVVRCRGSALVCPFWFLFLFFPPIHPTLFPSPSPFSHF